MHLRTHWLVALFLCVLCAQVCASAQTAPNSWEDKNLAGEKAFQEGKLGDANRLFYESLQQVQPVGANDVRVAPIYNNLALVAFVQNNFIASEGFYEKAIGVVERARGPEDLLLLPILDNLTRLYVKQWAFGKAIQTAQRVCRIREKKLGPENADTITSYNKLATLYLDSVRLLPHSSSDQFKSAASEEHLDDSAKLALAESLYRKVLAAQEKTFGAENARLVDLLQNLGEVLHAQGKSADAEQQYLRAIAIVEKSFAPDDLKLVQPLSQLAELKAEDGNDAEAEALYQRALRIDEKRLGPTDPSLRALLTGYAAQLEKMLKPEEARKLTDRATALADSRTKSAITPVSQVVSVPYVLRFEKSESDRYSGVHQTCLLIRADGRFRFEDQQHAAASSGNLIIPVQKPDDGMGGMGESDERVNMPTDHGAHPPTVFESAIDPAAMEQLAAILSAKGVREVQGTYPPKGHSNYYGAEQIAASILREGDVQNFAFPDLDSRQPFENSLKPLLRWLSNAEKHKGSVIKGAVANHCSPDLPQAVPMQFSGKRPSAVSGAASASAIPVAATSKEAAPAPTASASQTPTFKVNVNLVLVRVVVRDSQGSTIGTLHQEDFRLLDNRKPQAISRFSLERVEAGAGPAPGGTPQTQIPTVDRVKSPLRNLVFLFDDLNSSPADMQHAREAADHFLSALSADARAAIFSTSGQTTLDFTADHTALHEAVLRVQSRNPAGSSNNCPEIDAYMADLIHNKGDEDALGAATAEALVCAYGNDVRFGAAAEQLATTTAATQAAAFDRMNILVLQALQNALRRLDATPGQHTLVLVSSGFIAPGREQEFEKIMDSALRAGIVISTLDTRGLYHIDSVASSTRENLSYRRDGAQASAEILSTLADATGGTFFHNSNDLDEGFRHVAEAPEYSYVLGFAPADYELDGKFHPLTVELNNGGKFKVQARKGYYAPKKPNK